MPDLVAPSLDHLRTFLAVAEEGGFKAAARRLDRATSVVSYAVAQLESQLAVRLFEREGSRRPVLTVAGQALLEEARAVSDGVDALLARVRSLRQGLEAELSIAVEVMVPAEALAHLLSDFQERFPTVPLRLHVEALGAVAALVLERRATVAVAGPDILDLADLERSEVGTVELTPVAAPGHPLARMRPVPVGEARRHLQLVLTDRSPLTMGQDFAVLSPRSWRLADLGAKHALLKQGIGWGSMPSHMVAEDLRSGTLVALDLPEWPTTRLQLYAMWRRDTPPGPAAHWLLEELPLRMAKCP